MRLPRFLFDHLVYYHHIKNEHRAAYGYQFLRQKLVNEIFASSITICEQDHLIQLQFESLPPP